MRRLQVEIRKIQGGNKEKLKRNKFMNLDDVSKNCTMNKKNPN